MRQVPQPVEQAWFCCPSTRRGKARNPARGAATRSSVGPRRGGDDSFSRAEPSTHLEHGQISGPGLEPGRSETTLASFVRARMILPCDQHIPKSEDPPSSRLLLPHSRRRSSTLPVLGHSHAPVGTIRADLQALRAQWDSSCRGVKLLLNFLVEVPVGLVTLRREHVVRWL